ncbi:MarR family transcriptional regulator [Paenibacillus sp. LHD-117]|uniref:MarR family winged helix-turn-helix transcriptional regulator n=1 Tax=Paenibacillus sp. LHD-117 TaxID=3071412 RepID=UPI0027E128C1|nr:MarR family transcriptional regulator [Paenibacillus sp. LHD-117]MDQ6420140.1 MarR family transcriptional regulator [Paenibacillus sp. LHD-117]
MALESCILKDLIRRYEGANFVVERRLHAQMKDMMPEELTVDQFKMLRYLNYSGRCTPSELSDIFCVGKSSITAIVTRLSDKGLISRMPEESDRRIINLVLTEEGKRLCDLMEEQVEAMLAGYMNLFDEQEALTFIATFEKLARVMSET